MQGKKMYQNLSEMVLPHSFWVDAPLYPNTVQLDLKARLLGRLG
ncbi:hypothetical protein NIES3974_40190 [Calothrix sp. NIES-3974]|nr:hypothetical protein NIES3974_40190 [Calothrix sp. NIES-3974]